MAGERQEVYKTGGGRNRSYVDPNTERVAALLGHTATGFANSYDSDVITYEIEAIEKPEVEEACSEILEESMRSIEDPIIETTATDWSSWNPTQLKTKPSEKLAVRSGKKTSTDRQQEFWEEENKRAAEGISGQRRRRNIFSKWNSRRIRGRPKGISGKSRNIFSKWNYSKLI